MITEYLIFLPSVIMLANTEFFSAITELESLLITEESVINSIETYILKQEHKIRYLNEQLKLYKKEHDKAMKDPNFLKNPLNSFSLIKRLSTNWDYIESFIENKLLYVKDLSVEYPTTKDVRGAALALGRLQDTYLLKVADLADGILDSNISSPMSISDCFEVGKHLFEGGMYESAIEWMMVALEKYLGQETDGIPITLFDMIRIITYAYISLVTFMALADDDSNALMWSEWLSALSPNNDTKLVIESYENYVKYIKNHPRKETVRDGVERLMAKEKYRMQFETYKSLCRSKMDPPTEISRRLKCLYLKEHHPFLRLAPIKMEQLYLDPPVSLFHDVLSDDEIEHLKELSKPMLSRSLVGMKDDEDAESVVDYRISQTAWLFDDLSAVTERISQRTADFTGLSMESAERFQVLNYGIGGHYIPHHDYFPEDSDMTNTYGNRISTVIFYMSEVAQGGATVFVKLGLTVFPVKGAALVWPNLRPSGKVDPATLHAGCPVLRGDKWVGNRWIHEHYQEFLKPCIRE